MKVQGKRRILGQLLGLELIPLLVLKALVFLVLVYRVLMRVLMERISKRLIGKAVAEGGGECFFQTIRMRWVLCPLRALALQTIAARIQSRAVRQFSFRRRFGRLLLCLLKVRQLCGSLAISASE